VTDPENPITTATIIPQVQGVLQAAHPRLAKAIVEVLDAVCRRHIKEVRQQFAAAARLDDETALDDLPDVLRGMARVFRSEDGLAPLSLLGPGHASARAGQGFSLLDVFGEYVLLRRSLHENVVEYLGGPLEPSEREALQSAMDAMLATTLNSFSAQREARLKLETTALGHFLSSLAHDLRNEIGGVTLSMRALEENGLEVQKALTSVTEKAGSRAIQELGSLLRDVSSCRDTMESTVSAMTRLLEAERLRNKVVLHQRGVALLQLMQGIAHSAARSYRSAGHINPTRTAERIKVACPDGLVVWTDPDLLGTVLVNLLGNAVKYAPEKEIHFTASLTSDQHCRIEVHDQGPGIAAKHIEKLFDKFERGARSDSGGLGLGLFIARRAADLLGAKIFAESEVGRGSTFIIQLPPPPKQENS
jgi:signal transduction histidine kinase